MERRLVAEGRGKKPGGDTGIRTTPKSADREIRLGQSSSVNVRLLDGFDESAVEVRKFDNADNSLRPWSS
jgi:hypothetical protein